MIVRKKRKSTRQRGTGKEAKPLIKFYIPAGTYDTGLYFIFSEDRERVASLINKFQDRNNGDNIPPSTISALGIIFRKIGYTSIIWMPALPVTPRHFSTLVHEILHGVKWILYNWAGMSLGDDSEEAYCHLHSYFTEKCLTKIGLQIKKYSISK